MFYQRSPIFYEKSRVSFQKNHMFTHIHTCTYTHTHIHVQMHTYAHAQAEVRKTPGEWSTQKSHIFYPKSPISYQKRPIVALTHSCTHTHTHRWRWGKHRGSGDRYFWHYPTLKKKENRWDFRAISKWKRLFWICRCVRVYVCVYVCVFVWGIFVYVCIHTYVYVCVYTPRSVHMYCVCGCVCMCVFNQQF